MPEVLGEVDRPMTQMTTWQLASLIESFIDALGVVSGRPAPKSISWTAEGGLAVEAEPVGRSYLTMADVRPDLRHSVRVGVKGISELMAAYANQAKATRPDVEGEVLVFFDRESEVLGAAAEDSAGNIVLLSREVLN